MRIERRAASALLLLAVEFQPDVMQNTVDEVAIGSEASIIHVLDVISCDFVLPLIHALPVSARFVVASVRQQFLPDISVGRDPHADEWILPVISGHRGLLSDRGRAAPLADAVALFPAPERMCVPRRGISNISKINRDTFELSEFGLAGMELRHLRYFLAVAEELNFRRAAEKLGIAQPPLSSQIHDLENEIGVQLFRRVPKGAELTEAGAAFLSSVPTVFDKLDQAVKLAQRGGRGEVGQLRVGYTGSASFNQIVPRSLRAFRRAYPNVGLTLEELNSPQLLDQLSRQRLDAAFIRPGKEPPAGFTVTPLDEEPMMVVVPTGHRLAKRYAVDLAELKGEPFVLFSRAWSRPLRRGDRRLSAREASSRRWPRLPLRSPRSPIWSR